MKFPEAVLPKKDRPWLDGSVCIVLGAVLGTIFGSGIPYYLKIDTDKPLKTVNLQLQKACVSMKRRPVEDADGWMTDCILTVVPKK